jgi:hypothetical protein
MNHQTIVFYNKKNVSEKHRGKHINLIHAQQDIGSLFRLNL